MKMKLKTPISYYGGKQKMCVHILELIPEHVTYVEPFIGGAAIYFKKDKSKVEVINDLNGEVANFYKVLKNKYYSLNKLIQETLHSRATYNDAKVVYTYPHLFDDVKRAWAFWVCTQMGYLSKVGSWGYDRLKGSTEKKINNKKNAFLIELSDRLGVTQIECADALKVIKSRDYEKAFHYVDPPYIGTNCGHYSGYTAEDYRDLLTLLSTIKGKFLLSSFPTKILDKFVKENGWHQKSIKMRKDAAKSKSDKVEVLTANYQLETPEVCEFLSVPIKN